MAKHIVLYSDYYLEEITRQYDSVTGTPSKGGRPRFREVDLEKMADNRKQVISRSRRKVKQYVMHNFRPLDCRMITFTLNTSTALLWGNDLQEAVEQLRWFLKRLRRHLKKTVPQYVLKYIYVAEFHENRNSVHFHMISDMSQAVIQALPGIWKHGFVDADVISDREELLRRAGYLAKSFSDPRLGQGVNLFWNSKTIQGPKKVIDHEADVIMDLVDTADGEQIDVDEYETEYQGQTVHSSWAFDYISVREQLEEVNWT